MQLPEHVKIVEVGPRDGLQNEPESIPTERKIAFIRALAKAGLLHIEITSFVHPKRIPQLADAVEVATGLQPLPPSYSALVPNMRGLERAQEAGVKRIAVFTAASDTFTQKNIGQSIRESLQSFRTVVAAALSRGMTVRGYVSTCFGCPYEGDVDPHKVREVAVELIAMGVDEVSLGDTIGVAAPTDVARTMGVVLGEVPRERTALHFHDTSGTALANVCTGLEMGVTTFDSSAGGLGGCPYAPGAAGNLATEDLVYMLDRMGIKTGVNLRQVAAASGLLEESLHRALPSKQLQRVKAQRPTH